MSEKSGTKKKNTIKPKNVRKGTTVKRKKVNSKSVREKQSMWSYVFLWALFAILFVVVVFLGFLVFKKRDSLENKIESNISIPIVKSDSKFSFNINVANLSSDNTEYVFRVSNYQGDAIATSDLAYNIMVQNPTDAVIKLTKGDENENLMIEQMNTVLGDQKFVSSDKEDVYYHISVIKKGKKVTSKDLVSVIITS